MPCPRVASRLRLRIAATLVVGVVALTFMVGTITGSDRAAAGDSPLPTPSTSEEPPPPEESTTTTTEESTTTTEESTTTTSTTFRSSSTRRTVASTAARVTTTTEATTTTTGRNLLVAGDGTDGAESTTTTTIAPQRGGDDGLSESAIVWLIVAALVGIAVLIGVWTVRYWKSTKPDGPETESVAVSGASGRADGDDDPTSVF